jgi:hypothetical protein
MKISIVLEALTGSFETDMKRASKSAEKAAKQVQEDWKKVGIVLGGAIASGAAALTALTKGAINTADELSKTAQKVGIAVESLSTLKYAAEQSGVGVEQLQGGLVKLAKNASDAGMGVGAAVNGFDALGISVKNADGSLKGTDKLLGEIATKFAGYRDGAEKTALAVNLFGRAGADLIPLLNEGERGIEALKERARELGLEIGGETAKKAEEFNDLMEDLGNLAKGVGNDIARELLPSITQLASDAVDAGVGMRKGAEGGTLLADSIKAVIAVAATVKNAIEGIVNSIAGYVDVASAAAKAASEIVANVNPITQAWKAARGELRSFTTIAEEFKNRAAGAMMSSATGVTDAIDKLADTFVALFHPMKQTAEIAGAGDTGKTGKGVAPGMRNVAAANAEAQKSMEEAAKAAEKQRKGMQDLAVSGVMRLVDELEDMDAEYARLDMRFADQERQLREEIHLLGLTGAARDAEIIRLRAEEMARDETGQVIEEQAAKYRGLLTEMEAASKTAEQAQQFESMWMGALDSVGQAFGDFVTRRIKSFKDFGRALVDIAKNFVAQIIAEMAKAALVKWLTGQGGGAAGAWTAALGALGMGTSGSAGASGGGGMGGLGNMTSLIGGNNTFLVGAGNMAAAAPWALPAAGAIGGAYLGAQNRPNTGSRIAAGAAYGYAGYALGTVATGALIGAGAGAATGVAGAAAGGALAGGAGAAAAIPVIGWIVAALALIDMASGGKLFGTSFNTRGTTQSFGIGPEGGTASLTLQQERQAALFGGIRRRNVTRAATPEMLEAADALYQQNQQLVESVNRALMGDIDELLQGSLRVVQRYSKKGKLESTKFFVDILGRSWEESTMELAQTRLGAEQIISAIDRIMQTEVEEMAEGIAGPLTGLADRVEDSFAREMGQGAGSAMLGEASQIAERWRDDAEALMQGAQSLLAIASDLRHGFDLLGTGTLKPIVDLIDDLAHAGETMLQTYQRIAGSTQILESALDLMGLQLDLAREEFVRFAVDITDAAGGLDRASQLWNNYFNRFFSDQERGLLALTRAQTTGQDEFADIGMNLSDFTGEGGGAAFRALFTAALPTLSADAIVQWLEAAESLGVVIDLQAQYNATLQGAASATGEALRGAATDYAGFIQSFAQSTGFQTTLRELRWEFEAATQQAHDLARAAGMQAARAEDLAQIEAAYFRQREAAIADLTATIVEQIAALYGTNADKLQTRIDAIDEEASGLAGMRSEGTFGLVMAMAREAQLQAERQGLVEQLEAARASEEALRRQTGALDIARNLADLGLARGVSFQQLAQEFGLNVADFGADLGMTAEEIDELIQQMQDDAFTAETYSSGVDRIVQAILDSAAMREGAELGPPGDIDPPREPDNTGGKAADLSAEVKSLRIQTVATQEELRTLGQAQLEEMRELVRYARAGALDPTQRRSSRMKVG